MFKRGDKVVLCGCPYDEQIPEDLAKYVRLKKRTQIVEDVMDMRHERGTSGQWVRTDLEPNWIDKAWYRKEKVATSEPQGRTERERAANLRACEWAFIGCGLCVVFAAGFFAGQFLVGLLAGWM